MSPNSELLDALRKLKDAVQQLPESTPEGALDDIVGRNFASQRLQGGEGGIWEAIDQAYTRCFSKEPTSNPDPKNNVLKGRFGMDLVLGFFDTAVKSPELKSSEAFLVQLKLNQLTDLVYARIQSLPHDIPPRQTKKTQAPKGKQRHSVAPARSKNKPGKCTATTIDGSDNDGDYRPHANASEDDSEGSSYTTVTAGVSAADNERTKGKSKAKPQQTRPRTWSTDHRVISSGSCSDADSESDAGAPKESPQGAKKKKKWALSHFQAP
ncbi:hypothetical protein FRC06_007704, partial [Ceratobasidium sp. 370]